MAKGKEKTYSAYGLELTTKQIARCVGKKRESVYASISYTQNFDLEKYLTKWGVKDACDVTAKLTDSDVKPDSGDKVESAAVDAVMDIIMDGAGTACAADADDVKAADEVMAYEADGAGETAVNAADAAVDALEYESFYGELADRSPEKSKAVRAVEAIVPAEPMPEPMPEWKAKLIEYVDKCEKLIEHIEAAKCIMEDIGGDMQRAGFDAATACKGLGAICEAVDILEKTAVVKNFDTAELLAALGIIHA